jgi:hypothetical protein
MCPGRRSVCVLQGGVRVSRKEECVYLGRMSVCVQERGVRVSWKEEECVCAGRRCVQEGGGGDPFEGRGALEARSLDGLDHSPHDVGVPPSGDQGRVATLPRQVSGQHSFFAKITGEGFKVQGSRGWVTPGRATSRQLTIHNRSKRDSPYSERKHANR